MATSTHGARKVAGQDLPDIARAFSQIAPRFVAKALVNPRYIHRTNKVDLKSTEDGDTMSNDTTTITLPNCPGYSIELIGPHNHEYARLLAARATMRSGHPWVDTWDAELETLVIQAWRRYAPGWICNDNHGVHAHYAIFHHLWWAGHQLMNPGGFIETPVGGLKNIG